VLLLSWQQLSSSLAVSHVELRWARRPVQRPV
jgi:hypothetical protein